MPKLLTQPAQLTQAIHVLMAHIQYSDQELLALDTETNGDDPHRDVVFTLQLYAPGLGPVVVDLRTALDEQTLLLLNGLFGIEGLIKIFQNGKFDLKMLAVLGIVVPPPYFDTLLAGQILACGQQLGCKLGDLCLRYLGQLLNKRLQTSFLGLSPDVVIGPEQVQYAADDVVVLPQLVPHLETAITRHQGSRRTWARELNFLPVLADLETGGVRLRVEEVDRLGQRLQERLAVAQQYAEGYLIGAATVWGGYEPVNLDKAESVKAAMLAADIPYSSDKTVDLLKQVDYPGVIYLLEYRALKRKLEQVQQWQRLELRDHRKGWAGSETWGQFHLLPAYSQVSRDGGRLGRSRTGLETVLAVLEDEQEALLTRLLMPRAKGHQLIGLRFREGALRVLAQVSEDQTLRQIYAEGGSAVDWLYQQVEMDQTVAWSLWMGCGVFGYRKPGLWQEFHYETTGTALPVTQAKDYVNRFWELMPGLKSWHQQHPTASECSFTLSGRWCQNHRASHAQKMGHRVLGSLDDLIKATMVEIDRVLRPQGGRPYLVVGDYMIWDVPADHQQAMLDDATEVLKERARVMLLKVVKNYGVNCFGG